MYAIRSYYAALALGLMLTSLGFTIGLLRTVLTTDLPVTVQMGSWLPPFGIILTVITSYSIHYTKLYDKSHRSESGDALG